MKSLRKLFLSLGVFLCLLATASAATSRDGLWQAFDQTSQRLFFYLVYSEGQPVRLFRPDWVEYPAAARVEGNQLQFHIPYKNQKITFKGMFSGGRLAGDYSRPHVQFKIEGEWTARRVIDQADWDPWKALSEDKNPIDILNSFWNACSPGSFQEFEQCWQSEVESKFYPILSVTLYADEKLAFKRDLRQERLKQVYRDLKEHSQVRRSFGRKLPDLRKEVLGALAETYPWLERDTLVISLPSVGLYDYRHLILPFPRGEHTKVLLLGSDYLSGHYPASQIRSLLAQGLIYVSHDAWADSIGFEAAKRGIALLLAERLGRGSKGFESQIQDQSIGFLPGLKLELRRDYWKNARALHSKYFLDEKLNGYLLGRELARELAKNTSHRGLLGLQYLQLEQRMRDFLGGQIDPQPKTTSN